MGGEHHAQPVGGRDTNGRCAAHFQRVNAGVELLGTLLFFVVYIVGQASLVE